MTTILSSLLLTECFASLLRLGESLCFSVEVIDLCLGKTEVVFCIGVGVNLELDLRSDEVFNGEGLGDGPLRNGDRVGGLGEGTSIR